MTQIKAGYWWRISDGPLTWSLRSDATAAECKEEAEHGDKGDGLDGRDEGPEDAVEDGEIELGPGWSHPGQVQLRPSKHAAPAEHRQVDLRPPEKSFRPAPPHRRHKNHCFASPSATSRRHLSWGNPQKLVHIYIVIINIIFIFIFNDDAASIIIHFFKGEAYKIRPLPLYLGTRHLIWPLMTLLVLLSRSGKTIIKIFISLDSEKSDWSQFYSLFQSGPIFFSDTGATKFSRELFQLYSCVTWELDFGLLLLIVEHCLTYIRRDETLVSYFRWG